MRLYTAFDLHANNSYGAIIAEQGQRVKRQRLANDPELIFQFLLPYKAEIVGVVVESTYNWYWLVDALMSEGYKVHLANTAGIQKYTGLKHSDDQDDAFWLAEMLRLNILPEGHIYPNGNKYLAWAFSEAAEFARRYDPQAKAFYNRKLQKTNFMVAHNALAHKLARAAYHVIKERTPFMPEKLFAS